MVKQKTDVQAKKRSNKEHQDCQASLTTLTKQPFAEIPPQFPELVGKLGSPDQSHQF